MTCPTCDGSGTLRRNDNCVDCPHCDGAGWTPTRKPAPVSGGVCISVEEYERVCARVKELEETLCGEGMMTPDDMESATRTYRRELIEAAEVKRLRLTRLETLREACRIQCGGCAGSGDLNPLPFWDERTGYWIHESPHKSRMHCQAGHIRTVIAQEEQEKA